MILAVLAAASCAPISPPRDVASALRYSNICFHEESGDTVGFRVLLVSAYPWSSGREIFHVILQGAEGYLQLPMLGFGSIADGRLWFSIPQPNAQVREPPLSFGGTITPEEISGSFDGSGWTDRQGNRLVFHLKRETNVEHRGFSDCISDPP